MTQIKSSHEVVAAVNETKHPISGRIYISTGNKSVRRMLFYAFYTKLIDG